MQPYRTGAILRSRWSQKLGFMFHYQVIFFFYFETENKYEVKWVGRRKIWEKLGAGKNDKIYFMRFSKNKRNNIIYYKNILDANHASPVSHPCDWHIPNDAKQAFRLMKCTWKLILFPDLGLEKPIGKSVLQAKVMTKSRQPLRCL